MKRVLFWLNLGVLALVLAACGKGPVPPSAGDPHAAEQAAMEASTLNFSSVIIVRLRSEGKRIEVTSVLPVIVAEATVGQSAKTIFRLNEQGTGIVLFSRDLPNGKSFRTELTIADLEQKKSFNFPVVQQDSTLKERSFVLEKIVRQSQSTQ